MIWIMSPPKSINYRVKFFANNLWGFKNRKSVNGHRMKDKINQGQPTSLRQEFSFLALKFGGDFGNEILEIRNPVSSKFEIYAKIFS